MAVKTKTEVQVNEVKDQTDGTSEVQAKEIKDKAEVNIAEINKSLGKYSLPEYNERIYSTVYYQLRSAIGWTNLGIAKNKEMYFDWKEFKAEYKKNVWYFRRTQVPIRSLTRICPNYVGQKFKRLTD